MRQSQILLSTKMQDFTGTKGVLSFIMIYRCPREPHGNYAQFHHKSLCTSTMKRVCLFQVQLHPKHLRVQNIPSYSVSRCSQGHVTCLTCNWISLVSSFPGLMSVVVLYTVIGADWFFALIVRQSCVNMYIMLARILVYYFSPEVL